MFRDKLSACVSAFPAEQDPVRVAGVRTAVRPLRVPLHDHLHQAHDLHRLQTHQHRPRPQEGDGGRMMSIPGQHLSVAAVQEEEQSDDGRGDHEPDHHHGVDGRHPVRHVHRPRPQHQDGAQGEALPLLRHPDPCLSDRDPGDADRAGVEKVGDDRDDRDDHV